MAQNIDKYYAPRGDKFKNMIRKVLVEKSALKEKYVDVLLSRGMPLYDKAFTHKSIDPNYNYEYLEILGDVTANKCIIWYLHRRLPRLSEDRAGANAVITFLKNSFVSKKSFNEIGESLGFWDFISASKDVRDREKKSLLEDCFEAFIGATEMVIDDNIRRGVGYDVCYSIIKNVFDDKKIPTEYSGLKGSVTMLKELRESAEFKARIGVIEEKQFVVPNQQHGKTFNMSRYIIYRNGLIIGDAIKNKLSDAIEESSRQALEVLKREGIVKRSDTDYNYFLQE
jgi:dsRNA-specific ribonuclease